jgi:hypothetical protein
MQYDALWNTYKKSENLKGKMEKCHDNANLKGKTQI